jgi:hypothetical protein
VGSLHTVVQAAEKYMCMHMCTTQVNTDPAECKNKTRDAQWNRNANGVSAFPPNGHGKRALLYCSLQNTGFGPICPHDAILREGTRHLHGMIERAVRCYIP